MSSTLSDAYRDHPLHLNHIIPLDFTSVESVPHSHEWTQSSNESPSDDEHLSIPVVDLMDPNAEKLVRDACETWGVFQLTSHGVPSCLLEDVEFEALRFFCLSSQQKMKVLRSPDGATGYGLARISSFFNKFMWHEGFTIMGSPSDHAKELWPNDYQRFCDVMNEYQTKMKSLAERVWLLIMGSLGISKEEYSSSAEAASTALQLNYYPSCPNPSRAMGLAPHTDTLLFTILHQKIDTATTPTRGLQIFKDGIGWVSVRPVAGALVVNVGDLLHILSNAKFPSALHRVVVNQSGRLSVAYFHGPPIDARISPANSGQGQLPVYRSLTVKEYVRLKAKHHDKVLALIRRTLSNAEVKVCPSTAARQCD
nr:gibberellin 3-beta-dioxygenase 1 [Paeonia suffruticosa]